MNIKELGRKLADWQRTRNLSLAADICDELAKDFTDKAKMTWAEPTIEESE